MAEDVSATSDERRGAAEAGGRELAFWAFLLAALAMLAAAVLPGPYLAARDAERRAAFLRQINADLERGNGRLRERMAAIDHDPFYAEREVRLNLFWNRPEEQVLRLGPGPDGDNGMPQTAMFTHRDWIERAALRLIQHPKQRSFVFVSAAALALIAFLCFGAPRRNT